MTIPQRQLIICIGMEPALQAAHLLGFLREQKEAENSVITLAIQRVMSIGMARVWKIVLTH